MCHLDRMIAFLTKPTTLWILFVLFVLETIGFGLIMRHWDFTVIDDPSKPGLVYAAGSNTYRKQKLWKFPRPSRWEKFGLQAKRFVKIMPISREGLTTAACFPLWCSQ